MDRRRVWTVCKKELRETLRDRRTLVAVLLLPPLLYPLLALLSLEVARGRTEEHESLPSRVALAGEEVPELRAHLARVPGLEVGPFALPEGAVARGEAEVELVVRPGGAAALAGGGTAALELRWDGASDRSAVARDRLEEALTELHGRLGEERLLAEGLAPELVEPLRVATVDVAPPEKVGGTLLARMVPALLVILMMVGALYPAIDLTVGEKERGTLEVLLAAPVRPVEVVAGKFLAVAAMAMASGLVNVVSMGVTVATIVAQAHAAGAGKDVAISFAPGAVVALLASLALVALFFAALMMAIASPARTLKEAQAYVMPVYLACMVPAIIANLGGFELSWGLALVPLMGVTLLVRSLFLDAVPWGPAALALAAAASHAALALWFAARAFTRERVLFGAPSGGAPAPSGGAPAPRSGVGGPARPEPGPPPLAAQWSVPGTQLPSGGAPARAPSDPNVQGPGSPPPPPPRRQSLSVGEAVVLALAVISLMLTVGGFFQVTLGTLGFALSEWLLLPLPVLLAVRLLGIDPVPALSLRLPTPRALAGAALVGATAWYPALLAAMALAPIIRPNPETLKALEELVTTPESVWVTVIVFALSPAICEELLFRGAILSALRSRMAGPIAVVVTAALFAAFHMPPFRMAPTFVLGLCFGYAVWRSGSLACGVLGHLMNNALVVLAASWGEPSTSPDVGAALGAPPVSWPVGAGILAALALGLWTLWGARAGPKAGLG